MTDKITTYPEISVAPMMDWTDRNYRYFMRLISPHARLYTEMVTTGAIQYGDRDRHLRFDESEHPLALQLGGSSPSALADCAKMGEDYGYDEINLNCGCPSDRVQSGMFGACLMKKPDHVAECVAAMIDAVDIPVTVKCRLGVDDYDSFEFLDDFIQKNEKAGCQTFIIHARKAWLQGLSPKENREIPELNYGRVHDIKKKYPHLKIILNGGITTMAQIQDNLPQTDGVMIGREAYQNPYFMAEIERKIFGNQDILTREHIATAMIAYADDQAKRYQTPLKSITRHIIGLYHQQKGAKQWRRALSTLPFEDGATPKSVIETALENVERAQAKAQEI